MVLNPRPMIPESSPVIKPDVIEETATATENKSEFKSSRDRRTEFLLSDSEATEGDSVFGDRPFD